MIVRTGEGTEEQSDCIVGVVRVVVDRTVPVSIPYLASVLEVLLLVG